MIIRPFDQSDVEQLKEIYEAHYSEDFPFPNFHHPHYLGSFIVADSENKIICGGGIKTYAECVFLTNLNESVRKRREALLLALEASKGLTEYCGYDQLIAYPKDQKWSKILKKYGFINQVGDALQLDI